VTGKTAAAMPSDVRKASGLSASSKFDFWGYFQFWDAAQFYLDRRKRVALPHIRRQIRFPIF
jgi:hypothetical protein